MRQGGLRPPSRNRPGRGGGHAAASQPVPEVEGRGSTLVSMLRYLTAGEAHGRALVVIVEGLPAGLPVATEQVQAELARRRLGYGERENGG